MRIAALLAVLVGLVSGCAPSASSPTLLVVLPSPTSHSVVSPSPFVVASPSRPTTSFDADWLLFEWFAGRDHKDVQLVRADGSDRRVVAQGIEPTLEHADATWSPDGQTIAFVVGDAYDDSSIWTVPFDGAGASQLIGADDRCRLGVAFPSYSPDGRHLLFTCMDGTSGTSTDVHETVEVMDLASRERTPVVTLKSQEELVWPTWSPDARTALVTVNTWAKDLTTQTGSYLATVPIAGGPLMPLMDADTWATNGRWSPVDDRIVYATRGYGTVDANGDKLMSFRSTIETIKPDGSDHQTIWPGTDVTVGRVGLPHWTPDGDHLIVSVGTGDRVISDIHPATLTLDGRLRTIAALTSGVAFSPRPTR